MRADPRYVGLCINRITLGDTHQNSVPLYVEIIMNSNIPGIE
jgi:hypothetical protein